MSRSASITRRLGMRLVIEAEQMKHAVHDEMAEMIANGFSCSAASRSDGLEGEHDVAEQNRRAGGRARPRLPGRERQHIGRRVLPAVIAVEPLLLGSVGEGDAELDRRRRTRAQSRHAARHGVGRPLRARAVRLPDKPRLQPAQRRGDVDRSGQFHHDSPARAARSRAS